ncbi:transposase [Candidatus Gracilibacteria bacterium]|nr:transposase [Candidatus Gracilibacteria bacterium]
MRFGLTQPNKKGELKTHIEFSDLVNKSFENIKKEVNSKDKSKFDTRKELIDKINQFISGLENQLGDWKNMYERYDLISVNKDYYKILARKAKFDAFKKDKKGVKQPQANQIKLSSLRYNKELIINYWGNIISRSDYLINVFKPKLEQYLNAVNNPNNSSHTKPDLIDFRKVFLQLLKISEEYLQPLFNKSIQFETGKKENSGDIKRVNDFSGNENNKEINDLLDLGKEIREYFEANGSQVPYGKVSLNYYTAVQKPNNFDKEIKEGIKDLGIIEFLKKSEEDIKNYLKQDSKEKIYLLNNSKNPYSIELIQLFKPKTIPFSVKYNLSKYLEKNYNLKYEDILNKFDLLGKSVDIGKDYLECKDKEKFSLEKYPIKSAFDYSWENLARSLKRDVDFPKNVCEKYLNDNFNINVGNSSFNLYANLLFIAENLATIEYGKPNNEKEIIDSIKETFLELSDEIEKNNKKNEVENIIKYLNLNTDERKNIKDLQKKYFKNLDTKEQNILNIFDSFTKSKQSLGLLRGQQKNKIDKYRNLTQKLVDKKDSHIGIASFIGRTLASIREGLKEENELNKITDYGIIIEDKNQDKYILTLKLNGKDTREKIKNNLGNGEYKVFEINSFTSKALNKFIKNPLGEDSKKFHGYFQYKHREVSIYDENEKWVGYKEEFLKHLKHSLINSQIAVEQNWKDFGWNFDNCDTYEKIEKEVDKKGYKLIETSISKENLENLIHKEDCLLFPLINQDISSKKEENKNDFTKNFEKVFLGDGYRIHPEFSIFYRQPNEENLKPNKSGIINRFGRLQLLANIGVEYIPQNNDYTTRKEQNKISIDQTKQNESVQKFNKEKVNPYFDSLEDYYIFGIDRGIKQLATLCITNKKGVIQNFDIYTKHFNDNSKNWEYKNNRTEGILDLTNLKVESDKEGNKYLVDLSLFEAKDENGNLTGTNKQNVKLKQLAYIRKLQYQMSSNEEGVLSFLNKYKTKEERQNNIKELITPYKEGHHFEDLPMNIFEEMFENYEKLKNNKTLSEGEKQNLMKLTTELDASEDLKKGVVANIIGVIVHLMKEYDYKVKIAIEDLSNAWYFSKDGLSGDSILNSKIDEEMDLKKQDNLALAGVGTYHFFEMQLFKKLFKISVEKGILHLVPSFGNVRNYTDLLKEKYKYQYQQFGVIYFISPKFTSSKCPICGKGGKKHIKRENNVITCKECGFVSGKDNSINIKNNKKEGLNLDLIKNGDDNGSYNIGGKIK